jgi:hypothetical protein
MQVLNRVDEQYVVAKFLEAELASTRYGATVRQLMAASGMPIEVILSPDLTIFNSGGYCRRIAVARVMSYHDGGGLTAQEWARCEQVRLAAAELIEAGQ